MSMLLILDGGGITQVTVPVSDGAAIGEVVTPLLTRYVPITDLMRVDEVMTLRASRSVSDNIRVADRLTEAVALQMLDRVRMSDQPYTLPRLSLVDFLRAQELVTPRANYSQQVSDAVRITDLRSTAAQRATLTDLMRVSDQPSLRIDLRPVDAVRMADGLNENVRVSLTDYVRIAEALFSAMNVLTSVSDTIRVSDTPAHPGIGIVDKVAATDVRSFMQNNTYAQYDYLRARDALSEAAALSFMDPVRVTDTPGTTVRVSRALLDLLLVGDVATPLGGLFKTVVDGMKVTDTLVERAGFLITDLLNVHDAQANDDGIRDRMRFVDVAKIAIAMTVVDAVEVSDQPYTQPRLSIPADRLGILDTISRLDIRRQLVDGLKISEASAAYRVGMLVTDYARVAEAVLRYASRLVQDNVRVADPYSIAVRQAITDQLEIADPAAVRVQRALADFIAARDAMNRHTNVTIIDRTKAGDTTNQSVNAFLQILDQLRVADTSQHTQITSKLIVDTMGIGDPGISRAVSMFVMDLLKARETVVVDGGGEFNAPPEVVTAQAVRQAVKFARFLNETFRAR